MGLTASRADASCGVDDVAESAQRLGASVATASHQLGPLRRAALVTSRRDSTRILNRIASPGVLDVCAAACAVAHPPDRATA